MNPSIAMRESSDSDSSFWKSVRANLRMQHEAQAIPRVPREGLVPLSFAQERLWSIDRAEPQSTTHNLRAMFRLSGEVDVVALERSIAEIVRRHEILRTTFASVDWRVVQKISDRVDVKLEQIELHALPPRQQETEVLRLADTQIRQAFDLSRGPLMRVLLLRLSSTEHILVRTIHHIINDRWSDSIFLRELDCLYRTFCSGQASPLPELPLQYRDFAAFQREWLKGEVLASLLDFWKARLQGCAPAVLPVDHPDSRASTGQGGTQYLDLPESLSQALGDLSQREGLSLFVVLLCAFKALLYQYSAQRDLVVCVPVSGRQRVETKKLIGYFNNLVLLRSSLNGNLGFRDLLKRVSPLLQEAFEHQDLPLQQVADAIRLPGAVLSRVLFALQNVPSQPLTLADIRVTPIDVEEGIANFDLSLSVRQRNGNLTCIVRYRKDLFEAATITTLLDRYTILLEDLVAVPERLLGDLSSFRPESIVSHNNPVSAYTPPENEIEHRIQSIWREVLHIDEIGVLSNFFDLGGRSLAMIQVCNEIKIAFLRDLAPRDLFRDPTIRGMAEFLSRESDRKDLISGPTRSLANRRQAALNRQRQLMKEHRQKHGKI